MHGVVSVAVLGGKGRHHGIQSGVLQRVGEELSECHESILGFADGVCVRLDVVHHEDPGL